ncbi:MAG TPA: hypothetical protein VJ160_00460, partial [Anaerolineales bacterium]|nr:hypothetical protein [Anaerolineales bacterium]
APRLRSNLPADYRADDGSVPIGMISLSIDEAVQALRQSLGLTDEEAAAQRASLELAMSQPVPTATALNFTGDAPFTSTPTKTPLPTDTPTPLPTNTRPPATRTPTSTKTKEPTAEPEATGEPEPTGAATAMATDEPPAAADTENPEVVSYNVSPPPGDVTVCTLNATVHIFDPGPSDGISTSQVRMKYKESGEPYVYSDPGDTTLVSGGPDGDAWDATYSISITFDNIEVTGILGAGSVKFASPAFTAGPVDLDVWFIIEDNEGHTTVEHIGTYTVMVDCPDV